MLRDTTQIRGSTRGEVRSRTTERPVRVLYSYPQKIGAGRVCLTAWYQAVAVAEAGADVRVAPGAVARELPSAIPVKPTLARGKARIPFRILGRSRTLAIHDRIVARRLRNLTGEVDIVHTWPLASRETLRTAARLGIPTVLERPNAHTRYAYEVVARECERIGVPLPPDHEHAFNAELLAIEEEEYRLATALLCPSEFVVKTFLDEGFAPKKLVRTIYGFDEAVFHPSLPTPRSAPGLTALYVGVAAVRKGLHFALEAWLRSSASERGSFLIAGEMLPDYARRLSSMLSHPSVRILGHRDDIPELMRNADVLVLPTIEEGFGLVCTEALASGCVPLVSNACTELCRHMENALVHDVGDVAALTQHITWVDSDQELLTRLRDGGLSTAPKITWSRAGVRLLDAYREVIEAHRNEGTPPQKQYAVS